MTKISVLLICILHQLVSLTYANLEGPFLFWGPKELESYDRPALKVLEQDDLVGIYENQAAIVVFNNQDSQPLTSNTFPRLRKLLERKTMLILPQGFLDVHPEYINNETQVITVQGPNSERDAEITETFERLEDIYGEGRVLGVLGSSSNQEGVEEDQDPGDSRRRRRGAEGETEEDPEEELKEEQEQELKEAPEEVIYSAAGKILFYSSDYPILRYSNSEDGTPDVEYKLKSIAGVSSDDREQFSRLIVTFTLPNGKVTLRFRFPDSTSGYWSLGPVELEDFRGKEVLLMPPAIEAFMGAPKGFSYHCAQPTVFTNDSISLIFEEIQVQPQLGGENSFGMAYDCVGFTTVPIWSGIMVSFLLIFCVTIAFIMIADIKTMDRFENAKGKIFTFTVSE